MFKNILKELVFLVNYAPITKNTIFVYNVNKCLKYQTQLYRNKVIFRCFI